MPDVAMLRTRLENRVTYPDLEGRRDDPSGGRRPGAATPPASDEPHGPSPEDAEGWVGGPLEHQPLRLVALRSWTSCYGSRASTTSSSSPTGGSSSPPDLRGAIRFACLLRLMPFYSRRTFLERLLRSEEYWRLQERRLRECGRQLDQERLALAERQRQERRRERRHLEQFARIEGLLQQSLEPLRPIPRQHARLLEQHYELLEQQDRLLGRHGQALEQQDQLLERQRAAYEPQANGLELLGQLPAQHDRLQEPHRQALEQGASEHHRWIARAEGPQRVFLGEMRLAEQAPLAAAPAEDDRDDPPTEEVERFVEEAFRLLLKRSPEAPELAASCEWLRGAVGRIKGEFLQAPLGLPPTADRELPSPAASPPHPAPARQEGCRICGGDLVYKWSLKVLRGKHVAHYFECHHCRALQVVDPTWLGAAYADEDRPLEINPDHGRFSRNFSAYVAFTALHKAGLVAECPVVLDYGGGYGLLAQMLKSGAYEAWQTDAYIPVPFLAADRCLSDLTEFPAASFDLVFALEVLEHLIDPPAVLDRLARLLKTTGTLMLSTSIYYPGMHDHHWFYLATEFGQHITLWSHDALVHAAAQAGFRSLGHFPGNEGFFILLSKLPADALKARLDEAVSIMQEPDHLRQITAPWDLQAQARCGWWQIPSWRPSPRMAWGPTRAGGRREDRNRLDLRAIPPGRRHQDRGGPGRHGGRGGTHRRHGHDPVLLVLAPGRRADPGHPLAGPDGVVREQGRPADHAAVSLLRLVASRQGVVVPAPSPRRLRHVGDALVRHPRLPRGPEGPRGHDPIGQPLPARQRAGSTPSPGMSRTDCGSSTTWSPTGCSIRPYRMATRSTAAPPATPSSTSAACAGTSARGSPSRPCDSSPPTAGWSSSAPRCAGLPGRAWRSRSGEAASRIASG